MKRFDNQFPMNDADSRKGSGPRRSTRWTPGATLALPLLLLVAVDTSSTGAEARPLDRGNLSSIVERVSAVSPSLNRIESLSVQETEDGSTTLRLRGSAKPTFNVYRLSSPDRLVIDVSRAQRGKVVPHVPVDTWAVGRVAVSTVDDADSRSARIVIDLKRAISYIVVPKGDELIVTVTPKEMPPEAYFSRKSAGKRRAEIATLEAAADRKMRGAENRAEGAEQRAKAADVRARAAAKEAEIAESRAQKIRASAKRLRSSATLAAEKAAMTAESRVRAAEGKATAAENRARRAAGTVARAESDATRAEGSAARAEGRAARAQGKASEAEGRVRRALRKANSAEGKARAAEDKARAAEGKVRAAEGKLTQAEGKQTQAEGKARAAEGKAHAAEGKARAAEGKAHVAQDKMMLAEGKARSAKGRMSVARKHARAAENKATAAQESALVAENRAVAAEKRATAAETRAKRAERRAKKAAVAARLAENHAVHVERKAEGVQLEAEAMLAQANLAMANAEVDSTQAATSRKLAQKAVADARRARRTRDGKNAKQSSELKRALEQAKIAEKAARGRQSETERRLSQLKVDHARLKKAVSARDLRNEQLETVIAKSQKQLTHYSEQVATARKQYESLGGAEGAKKAAQSRAQTLRLQTAHNVLKKEVERLRHSKEDANARTAAANKKLTALRKKGASQIKIARAEAALAAERTQERKDKVSLDNRSQRLAELGRELAQKQERIATLDTRRRELESRGKSLSRANRSAKAHLAKAEGQLLKLQRTIDAKRSRFSSLETKVAGAEKKLAATLKKGDDRRSLSKRWEKQREVSGASKIRGIRFEDAPGESRIVIEVDGPLEYDASSLTPHLAMLKMPGTAIPEALERSLDTSSYNGPVGMISSFSEGGDVKIIVAAKHGGKPNIEIDANKGRLVWHFPRTKGRGRSEVVSLGGNKVSGFASAPAPLAKRRLGKRSRWRGERIDIELQDAPIKDVLLLFSDIGRVNIIAGQGVNGKITMKLASVPWDQALDIILRSLGLGMEAEGNVIRVAKATTLEEERRKRIEKAASEVQLRPLNTELVPLSYATVGEMVPKVQSVLSSRGTVTPDSRTNTLIIMDVAENIVMAKSLVTSLDTQTPQVLIEARIVEARTSWLRSLGIQWGFDYIQSAGTGNPTGLLFPNSMGVAGGSGSNQSTTNGLILPGSAASPNYAVDLPAPVGTGAGGAVGFSFGNIAGTLNTNLRLSAAEDEGEVRIISAPKIVTLDNTQAQIEQGVQIPISQVSAQGVNTRYVNATLALRVTPHVTNEGSVLLDVNVQKNEADFINTGARGDPTILTKNAQSQMLITDGDTAVIGGIYTRNQSINRKKIPWIADIPIIGWFFKNKSEGDTRTEVLIFMTPKIINRSTSIGDG